MKYTLSVTMFDDCGLIYIDATDDLDAVCKATEYVMQRASAGSLLWAIGRISLKDGNRAVHICDRFNTIDHGRLCDNDCRDRHTIDGSHLQ